jgi:hypothetical protein
MIQMQLLHALKPVAAALLAGAASPEILICAARARDEHRPFKVSLRLPDEADTVGPRARRRGLSRISLACQRTRFTMSSATH